MKSDIFRVKVTPNLRRANFFKNKATNSSHKQLSNLKCASSICFGTAVCFFFFIKLRWSKNKSIYLCPNFFLPNQSYFHKNENNMLKRTRVIGPFVYRKISSVDYYPSGYLPWTGTIRLGENLVVFYYYDISSLGCFLEYIAWAIFYWEDTRQGLE